MSAALVSVVMPYWNSRATLARALASLQAQTYPNWELIFVDDGSSDRPQEVLESLEEPRIRYFRCAENRGRGAARSLALQKARGDFLCMLDADDWLYPNRFALQLEVMREEPRVHLVTGGLAVVDGANRITGARRLDDRPPYPAIHGPLGRLCSLPVAHASSMVRMPAAREAGYDPDCRSSEDKEFLLRLLLARPFCILPRLVYAYTESEDLDLQAVLNAYGTARRVYALHKARFPVSYRATSLALTSKSLVCRAASRLRLGRFVVRWRSRRPTRAEIADFEKARLVVERYLDDGAGSREPARPGNVRAFVDTARLTTRGAPGGARR